MKKSKLTSLLVMSAMLSMAITSALVAFEEVTTVATGSVIACVEDPNGQICLTTGQLCGVFPEPVQGSTSFCLQAFSFGFVGNTPVLIFEGCATNCHSIPQP